LKKRGLSEHGGEIPFLYQVSDAYVYILIPPVLKQFRVFFDVFLTVHHSSRYFSHIPFTVTNSSSEMTIRR